MKLEQRSVKWFSVELSRSTALCVYRSSRIQCPKAEIYAFTSTVKLFANKYVASNHE